MGLLGSLARRSASAALRGGGRLVVSVVPDSITPWNLRKQTSRTSASILTSLLRELHRKPKKQTPTRSPKKSGNSLPASKRQPLLNLMSFGRHQMSSETIHRAASVQAPLPPRKAGPRPSTTKGVYNLSRRTSAPAAKATERETYGTVRGAIANEERFDLNAWKQGRNLVSNFDRDDSSNRRPRVNSSARSVRARTSETALERHSLRFKHAKSKPKASRPAPQFNLAIRQNAAY